MRIIKNGVSLFLFRLFIIWMKMSQEPLLLYKSLPMTSLHAQIIIYKLYLAYDNDEKSK